MPVGTRGVVLALALVVAGGAVLAQQLAQSSFKVGFAFKVGSAEYPAGSYQVSYRSGDRFLTLLNAETGESAMLTFVTRLSPREKGGIVFDRMSEGSRRLTEIYLGGSDGFLLDPGKKEEHQHERVDANP
jgi:hypothetical protein